MRVLPAIATWSHGMRNVEVVLICLVLDLRGQVSLIFGALWPRGCLNHNEWVN